MAFESPNNILNTPVRIGLTTIQDPTTTNLSIASSQNSFSQVYIQNKSAGDTASTDLVLGADNDDATLAGHYANLGIFFGSGVPTLSAAQGSLYIRTDGSTTSTRMYINANGATTWTSVITAA